MSRLKLKHEQIVNNMSYRAPKDNQISLLDKFVQDNCHKIVEVKRFKNGISKYDFVASDGYILATLHLPTNE